MAMQAFRSAVRWLGFGDPSATGQSHRIKSREPLTRRRLGVESLEERRVLSAGNFAAALYQDVLGRAADPSGLAYYTKLLANSTPPSTVVNSFWNSAEHRGNEVDSYYQTFLNRPADPTGRQSWIDALSSGTSEEVVMENFLVSAEFQQLHPTPDQFVTALYQEVLGRAPDPAGFADFVGDLNNGVSTANVAWRFVTSDERHVNLVNSLYANDLGRAPDADGQAYWVQQLDQGLANDADAAQSFLLSQEFIAANPLPALVAAPGQIVVNVFGNGYVTDSTGQIDTRVGRNVGVYGPSDTPTLKASSPTVGWSDIALTGQNPVVPSSEFANGLNLTVFFS